MEIRVSVAERTTLRIDGKYGLVVSMNGLERGERSLGPAGGGVKTTPAGLDDLVRRYGIDPATFEKGTDLRFVMDDQWIVDFRKWLARTDEREWNTIDREFAEEMVQRELLTLEEAERVTFCWVHHREDDEDMWSYKDGVLKLVPTHCLEHVYDTVLPQDVSAKLLRAAAQPDALIEFVTAAEIKRGRSERGSEIAPWTRFLLVL